MFMWFFFLSGVIECNQDGFTKAGKPDYKNKPCFDHFGRSVLDSARCHSTNAAYGVSDATLQIDLQASIGTINLLEIEK